MSESRVKKSLRNIVFGVIYKIILILCPFVVRTILIKLLGIEYVGLTGLFSSIIGALSLTELGFGGIIVYFLYKPIAENDWNKVCALLNYYKTVFRVVGSIILTGGLCVTPFLTLFIHGDYPDTVNIYVIYIILLFNTGISYLLSAYKAALIMATQRDDIESKIASLITILTYVAQIVILVSIKDYYSYIIVTPISTVFLNILRSVVINKTFPPIEKSVRIDNETKKQIWNKVKSAIGFKLDSTILSSADSIVISSFLGLSVLGKYNNYLYIVTSLFGFFSILINSIRPGIGNSVVVDSPQKNENDLFKISFAFSWILGWASICLLCLYQDFIVLWLGEDYLLPFSTVILFVIYFYEFKMIESINMYKDSLGYWDKDAWRPYIEGLFNLIINIVLVKFLGLNGVIISTICASIIFAYPTIIYITYKNYFHKSPHQFLKKIFLQLIINIVLMLIVFNICSFINLGGWLGLLLKCAICLFVPNIISVFIYRKSTEFRYYKNILIRLFRKLQ